MKPDGEILVLLNVHRHSLCDKSQILLYLRILLFFIPSDFLAGQDNFLSKFWNFLAKFRQFWKKIGNICKFRAIFGPSLVNLQFLIFLANFWQSLRVFAHVTLTNLFNTLFINFHFLVGPPPSCLPQ